jgi:hypothetical protein
MKNNLFNLESIKKYTNNLLLTPQKRIKLERYVERVHNNEFKGETKGYPAFLKFLEDILDYEEDHHIVFDDNVDIGKDRVEFALKDENGKFMVIELKGQDSDLDKPQNRANDKRTPVEQAFGYAQKSSKKSGLVNWILVSNYKEFRLYNYDKRQGEYISFNVDDLLKDEGEFKYFLFSFSKESHIDLNAINEVINEDYIEKTQLANNFYKLFHETRLMIFEELKELNGIDKVDAVSYAQTILDRFIFICFASSRDLLPDNIAHKTILKRIKNDDLRDNEVWRELNFLFKDVNEGREDKDISGYNGGLFKDDLGLIFNLTDIKPDKDFFKEIKEENKKNKNYQKFIKELYDKVKKEIKPSILEKLNPIYINLLIISFFEFSEEKKETKGHRLDIEILGHIFENSISDIEGLKEDSIGRRKKEGIFYTPDYITDYICKNTIIPYLSKYGKANTVENLLQEYSQGREVEKLDQKITNIKIVDPSCGSGAFLNKATDILLDIHKGIFEIKKGYVTSGSMRVGKGKRRRTESVQHMDLGAYVFDAIEKRRKILLNNIYGVDLNPESVEITKLSLFLKVCEKGKKLPELDKNIKNGNSLIDNLEYTDKPFKWKEEFKGIFEDDGFDIVIGNPPYVNAKTLTDNMPEQRAYLTDSNTFKTLYQKWDLYIPFIEKGLQILKTNGLCSMIIPYPFINQNYAKLLRKCIIKNFNLIELVDLSSEKIFSDAEVTNCIPIISKEKNKNRIIISEITKQNIHHILTKNNDELVQDNKTSIWDISTKKQINKDFSNLKTLGDFCFISIGMVLNANEKIAKGEFKKEDLISDVKTDVHKKQYIEGKDLERYNIKRIRFLEWDTDRVPSKIRRPTFVELHETQKIVINKIGNIKATLDNNNLYCEQTIRIAILWKNLADIENKSINNSIKRYSNVNRTELEKNSENMKLKFILAIINSNMGNYFIKKIGGRGNIDINPEYLKKIPIPEIPIEEQKTFIEKTDEMILLNNSLIDEINGFKDWLQRNYHLEKFSQKLDKYYELSFDDFLGELKKKKIDTKQRKIQELLKNEFEESISKINPLLQEIKETDEEINQMVYDLYGLTKKEIEVIKDSLK